MPDEPAPRRRTRRASVRVRILTTILVVTAFGMAIASGTAFLVQREVELQEVDDHLRATALRVEAIVARAPAADAAGDAPAEQPAEAATTEELLAVIMSRIPPLQHEGSIALVDEVIRWSPPTTPEVDLSRDEPMLARMVAEAGADGAVVGTVVSEELGSLRYLAMRVGVEGDPAVGLYVTAVDLDSELNDVNTAFAIYALISIGALAVIGLVGWFVSGRLLRPIRQLERTAARITGSDLGERIPVVGNDDISGLTRTMNGMFDRIDGAMTGQRQLLDDVRHELRTPITIVQGHLELLDPDEPDDVRATRDLALDELERMARLVKDIEALARADGDDLARLEPVDLEELSAQVFAKVSVVPGRRWALQERAAGTAMIDPGRITQAWLQLADNAVKYSDDGSAVTLGSRTVEGMLHCWVQDEGHGIPPEARERIFERFGRVDTGRGVGGSGLGLPIVAAIAASHGGRVELESVPGLGSRFTIVVPLRAGAEEGTDG
ncbi:MAG: HAMP domain-containing sensor histidine kinase [Microbacteriaceae bacterium]